MPKKYIYADSADNFEILLYRCLSYLYKTRTRTVGTSINEILELCHCSIYSKGNRENTHRIKALFNIFIARSDLTWDNQCDYKSSNNVNANAHLRFKVNKAVFDPPDNFVILYDTEWDKLMSISNRLSKSILLRVYLYIKSWNFQNTEIITESVCGCHKKETAMAEELHISARQLDNYLKALCNNGLIVKHITGSYKKNGKVYNAPNVYVLGSDLNAQQHIQEAVDRLKYAYKVDEFLPMVHKNKKIRKD